MGKLSLQEILNQRSVINEKVISDLKEEIDEWGLVINNCGISNIEPTNKVVKQALNDQINAEQSALQTRINADSI